LGAAGATEAAFCVLALQGDGRLPPHVWDGAADPDCRGFFKFRRVSVFRRGSARICMSNSFAFGGSNATLIWATRDEAGIASFSSARSAGAASRRHAMAGSVTGGDVNAVEARRRSSAGWYLDERGCMPAWMGIELMAQAVAAHAGLRGWLAGKPPKPGVLLGCPRLSGRRFARRAGILCCESPPRRLVCDESGFGAYDCCDPATRPQSWRRRR